MRIILFRIKHKPKHSVLSYEKKYINAKISQIVMNLQFLSTDKHIQSYVVSSVDKWSDSVDLCTILAIEIAKCGKNVLLINADLRNSTQNEVFKISKNFGLPEALIDIEHLEQYIMTSKINGVSLLSSGRGIFNSVEFLGSDNMTKLIQRVEEIFDVVLVNVPSLSQYSDGQVIASKVDQVILLSKFGKTKGNELFSVVNSLQNIREIKPYIIGID